MGAGKTTVGKALSKELNIPFYDLDWYIESRRRKTVPQLFAEVGEAGFREIERSMLHEVAEFEDVIISCGGGTPCFFDNMAYMNQQGQVVYLQASPEVLHGHLLMGKTERPLLKNKSKEELLDFIKNNYRSAGIKRNIIDIRKDCKKIIKVRQLSVECIYNLFWTIIEINENIGVIFFLGKLLYNSRFTDTSSPFYKKCLGSIISFPF